MEKTQNAQPMGTYKLTAVDVAKAECDFRLLQTNPNVIRWIEGKTETVSNKLLKELQRYYTWMTDF